MKVRLTYELHLHSCLSPCGEEEMTPNNIAGMAALCGTKIAALTDHNAVDNCPAFFTACRRVGVIPVAGMELTTAEEIHMVCLFATLEEALAFGDFVKEHRTPIKNRPEIFGNQYVLNSEDEVEREEEILLIPATDLDLTAAAKEVFARGGAAFPAHIDKSANGLIEILADFPAEPGFAAAEFADYGKLEAYRKRFPILETLCILQDSDAHRLEAMNPAPLTLSLELPEGYESAADGEDTVRRALISKLRGENRN